MLRHVYGIVMIKLSGTHRNGARMAQDTKKRCYFKANNIQEIDYKDVRLLQRFLTFQGKILPSRITSVSKKYQNMLSKAVKRARQAGLLTSRF